MKYNIIKKSILVTRKAGCLVNIVALLVGCLGGSVVKVDNYGALKKKLRLKVWVAGDASRVSSCFRYLHISDILCK